MSQAAVALSCALVIIGAKLGRSDPSSCPRALAAWIPFSIILGSSSATSFGGEYIFIENWIARCAAPWGKEFWLSFGPRVLHRPHGDAPAGILAVLTPDLSARRTGPPGKNSARSGGGPSTGDGLFASLDRRTGGETTRRRRPRADKMLRRLAPHRLPALRLRLLVRSAFDQVMALSPAWFSNIFGWYVALGRLALNGHLRPPP